MKLLQMVFKVILHLLEHGFILGLRRLDDEIILALICPIWAVKPLVLGKIDFGGAVLFD